MKTKDCTTPFVHRPRVVVVYAGTGSRGHRVLAENYAELMNSLGIEVVVVDVFRTDRSNRFGFWIALYFLLLRLTPRVWRFLYHYWPSVPGVDLIRRHILPRRFKHVQTKLLAMAPDLVISTHPVATAIVDFLKHRRKLKMPLWVAFSDWHFQRFWTFPKVDHYFVPVEGQREELKRMGVCRDNVSVVGMLLSADYYGPKRSKARARAKLRLDSNASIVLILGGGTGWALEKIISAVSEMDHTFVVVAGSENRQKELQEYVSKVSFRGNWRVFPWVHTLPFLVAADVVVAKPGGLTTAEALHLKKALILCSAIPGHEEQNARVLRDMGVPWALQPHQLPDLIAEVLEKRNRAAHAANSHTGPHFLSTTTPRDIGATLEEVIRKA